MTAQGSSPHRRLAIGLAAGAAVLVALVVLFLLLGGGGGVSLADAADRMEGQNSRARFDMDVVERSGSAYSFAGEGAFTADGTRARMEGTFTEKGGEPVEADMIMVGDEMWAAYPSLAATLPKGKRWVHMVDETMVSRTMTPSEFVTYLRHAGEVENLGEEPVLGTRATHFRGKLDVADLAEETGGEAEQRFGNVDAELPIDVWVGDDELPKLIRMDIDSGGEQVRMEIEMLEYGVQVDSEPPPERSVVEESELDG